MRTLKFLLRKEFIQIFRNKLILRMIFGIPIIQLTLLPFAANYEMKNILITVVDLDHSETSRKLIDKFTASGYFRLTNISYSYEDALEIIEENIKIKSKTTSHILVIEMPKN